MPSDPAVRHRPSLISERDQRRATDDRVVDQLRIAITKRVDGPYLPRVLSRPTLVAAITELSESSHIQRVAETQNYVELRLWLAELCDLDYDPKGERRNYPFRKRELQGIDYTLADAGLEATADLETDTPPLARHL